MENFKKSLIQANEAITPIYFNRNERDFSYELYHQLRRLKLDIDVTAETPKTNSLVPAKLQITRFFTKYFFRKENFDVVEGKFKRVPDLLFHEYKNKNNQLFALEIKPLLARKDSILMDIAKLMFYTKGVLKFKKGILILYSRGTENQVKLSQLKNEYAKVLKDFLEIEIWIVYPKRVDIIWANGTIYNEMH